jgi:hypothetical protein
MILYLVIFLVKLQAAGPTLVSTTFSFIDRNVILVILVELFVNSKNIQTLKYILTHENNVKLTEHISNLKIMLKSILLALFIRPFTSSPLP